MTESLPVLGGQSLAYSLTTLSPPSLLLTFTRLLVHGVFRVMASANVNGNNTWRLLEEIKASVFSSHHCFASSGSHL